MESLPTLTLMTTEKCLTSPEMLKPLFKYGLGWTLEWEVNVIIKVK